MGGKPPFFRENPRSQVGTEKPNPHARRASRTGVHRGERQGQKPLSRLDCPMMRLFQPNNTNTGLGFMDDILIVTCLRGIKHVINLSKIK